MEIKDARIKDVIENSDSENGLTVDFSVRIKGGECHLGFNTKNAVDAQRLERIMEYIGSHEYSDLNGKTVRVANKNRQLQGIGHPYLDRFIPMFTEDFQQVTESKIEEMIKDL